MGNEHQDAAGRVSNTTRPTPGPKGIFDENHVSSRQADREERWGLIADVIGDSYSNATISDFLLFGTSEEQKRQGDVLRRTRRYGLRLIDNLREGKNLVFYGPQGTGKDLLMTACLRVAVVGAGATAHWENGSTLFAKFRDAMRQDSEVGELELIRRLSDLDILAISDPVPPLGDLTDFQATTLFSILDARYRRGASTWLTMNIESYETGLKRIGSQLMSRILHNSDAIYCKWESRRDYDRRMARA